MKNFFTICLVCASALAVTACSDKKVEIALVGAISVNGHSETVGSGFCDYSKSGGFEEGSWSLLLCKDVYDKMPESEPGFYIGAEVSDSYMGKVVDLTEPLSRKGTKPPFVSLAVPGRLLEIDENGIDIYLTDSDKDPDGISVSEGSLKMTRDGAEFTLQLSVRFSDGVSAAANWGGKVTRLIPDM